MLQQITKENFNQMLGQFSTADLEHLLEKSPYFQQAHLLLAKKYQLENNPKFDQQLQLAALYTQDRELLFKIFHEMPVKDNQLHPEPVSEVVIEPKRDKPELADELLVIEQPLEQIITPTFEPEATKETEPEQVKEPKPELIKEIEYDLIKETEQPAHSQFLMDEPHLFGEWLQAFNKQTVNQPPAVEKTADEMDEELNKLVLQNLPVNYLHELVEEETRYSKGLDQFIEEQIEKHKQGYVKPKAEKDIDPELITETMARVYEMQKKYQKAIKAYEILALKIPEKNDFFAARINYLKNII
jgi:hypothetical protein